MNRGIDVLGADTGGLVSSLFQAGGGVVDFAKASEKEKKDTAADNAKLQAVITADKAATNAVAQACVSAAQAKKDPSKASAAKADQMAADAASASQDKAAATLPDSKKSDRINAAQSVVDSSAQNLQSATRGGDANKIVVAQCQLDAANKTLTKAQGGDVGGGDKGKGDSGDGGESFFSKKIVGPVKVWMAGLAVAAVGGFVIWRKARK